MFRVVAVGFLGLGLAVRQGEEWLRTLAAEDDPSLAELDGMVEGASLAELNGTGVGDVLFEFVHKMPSLRSPCLDDTLFPEEAVAQYEALARKAIQRAEEVATRNCLARCAILQMKFSSAMYRLKKCMGLPVPDEPGTDGARTLAQTVWDDDSPLNLGFVMQQAYGKWQSIIETKAANSLASTDCTFNVGTMARDMFQVRKGGPEKLLELWRPTPQPAIEALKTQPTRIPGSAEWFTCKTWNSKYVLCGDFCCCKPGSHYVVKDQKCQKWEDDEQVRLHYALWEKIDHIAGDAFGKTCAWTKFSFRSSRIIRETRASISGSLFVAFQQGANFDEQEMEAASAVVEKKQGGQLAALLETHSQDIFIAAFLISAGLILGGSGGTALIIVGIAATFYGAASVSKPGSVEVD